MNKKLFSFTVLLMFISLTGVVFAQQRAYERDNFENLQLDGFVQSMSDSISNMLKPTFTMPTYPDTQVSFMTLILTFIIFFSILTPAAYLLPIFKRQPNLSGARKGFSVAVALLVTFFSPFAMWAEDVVHNWLNWPIAIGLLLLFIFLFLWMFRSFGSGMTNLRKSAATDAKTRHATSDALKQLNYAKRMGQREDHALHDIENLAYEERRKAHSMKARWENIINRLSKVDSVSGEQASKLKNQILHEVSNIMRVENDERSIHRRVKNLQNSIENRSKRMKADITQAEKDLKIIIKKNPAANNHLRTAKNCNDKINDLEKKLNHYIKTEYKDEKHIIDLTNQFRNYVSVDHKKAINIAKHILSEISKEEHHIRTIMNIENEIERIERSEVYALKKAIEDLK